MHCRRRTLLGALAGLAGAVALRPLSPLRAETGYQYARQDSPARTVVTDPAGAWLATFTDGAVTVTLTGPTRTFSEPTAAHPVMTPVWVRTLNAPFAGMVDEDWLTNALADTRPDLFALAQQYLHGAPPMTDESGQQFAGEARYGPALPNGRREEGADFYDYLGLPWTFGDRVRQPDDRSFRSLDCSGYMRMLWGFRSGLPLTYVPDGISLPRHSWEMAERAPGVTLIANAGTRVTDLSAIAPGDLVFFKWDDQNPHPIDHVGMFLGTDAAGRARFISSRQTFNGPTMGDSGGASLLDGTGLWARAFRAARRL